jgi:hypothetical protein
MKELSLHILDIVENSTNAGATRVKISINEDKHGNNYAIDIEDNGKGMSEQELEKAVDPFYSSRTTRKIGLGLSLLKQAVEHCDGKFSIHSQVGTGTKVSAKFQLNHIDRQPLGDIAGVLIQLLCSFPNISFVYEHHTNEGTFVLDSEEINETLGNVSVSDKNIRNFLIEMILENLNAIKISK